MAFNEDEVILGDDKLLEYSTDGGTTFITIFGTKDCKLPEAELGKAEFTNDSSPGHYKQYIPGWFEPGAASLSYVYTATVYALVETLFQSRQVLDWRYTLGDGSTSEFSGFLTKNPLPVSLEEVPMVEAEIQVSGPAVFTSNAESESSGA
jgi:hypothetical protein